MTVRALFSMGVNVLGGIYGGIFNINKKRFQKLTFVLVFNIIIIRSAY